MSTKLSEENKEFIKDTSVFIENTNRESMEMIKEGILRAINGLPQYKSENSSGPYYLKEEDVLAAIERGYTEQVKAYEDLRKDTIAGITGDNSKDDEEKITKLHTITKDVWARARSTPLPPSNSNSSNSNSNSNSSISNISNITGYNKNNENVKLLSTGDLLNNRFARKHKKSRKHSP